MDYKYRWKIIAILGQGNQGRVYRVIDTKEFDIDGQIRPDIENSLQGLVSSDKSETRKKFFELYRWAMVELIQMEDPENQGALKVLHKPKEAKEAKGVDGKGCKTELSEMIYKTMRETTVPTRTTQRISTFKIRATSAAPEIRMRRTSQGMSKANRIVTVRRRPTKEHKIPVITSLKYGELRNRSK